MPVGHNVDPFEQTCWSEKSNKEISQSSLKQQQHRERQKTIFVDDPENPNTQISLYHLKRRKYIQKEKKPL